MRSTFSSVSFALLLACGPAPEPTAPPPPPATEAQRLLAEAGFPGGRGFPRLTLLYNTSEHHKRIAAAVQEMWRRQLAIDVELVNTEWKVCLDRIEKGDYDIARRGYIGEYMDPLAFLSLFTADSGLNSTGWSSADYERLLAEAETQTNQGPRYERMARAERLLLDQGPVAPLYHYVSHNWLKPFVKGVHPSARDMHPFQAVTLEGEGAPADGALIYNGGEEPHSLDPALSDDILGLKILSHLFEGLAAYDAKDGAPVPAAAKRWVVAPDGLTWTFHLRESRWSNGDPVTAGDFVYAWRRAIDPATGSTARQRMYPVKHARAIARGELPVERLGVIAKDARTLEVRLERPTPFLPHLLCLSLFFPVHRATVEKHGDKWATRPATLIGNGPYRMTLWRMNDRKEFERSATYRAASDVRLARFVILSVREISTGFRMYEAGQCHWIFNAPTEFMDTLAVRPDHLGSPYNGTYFYIFNVRKKPLDDVRVRRALSLAIDRRRIVEQILRGGETPATRLTPHLYPGYEVP